MDEEMTAKLMVAIDELTDELNKVRRDRNAQLKWGFGQQQRARQLEEVMREELSCTWGDLEQAQRRAANDRWSIECTNLEDRIKRLTPLVGPTPWEDVGVRLLENGVYQRIHAEMDIAVEPDMARVADVRKRIDR